jgi:hypothetical protein
MDDLITWFRAQLDVDQSAAEEMKRVFPTPWELADRGWMARIVADGPHFPEVIRLDQEQAPGVGELDSAIRHVLLQDPDRVLREVEAKRRTIDLHVPANPDAVPIEGTRGWPDKPWLFCRTCGSGEAYEYPTDWPCATVRLLALPFSDRPGYREEWKP